MSGTWPSPAIKFANEHINSDISTFDASSAIQRLELLIDDAADAKENLDPVLSERLVPAFFEFVSYYQIGFVTCLEWHAKSRLFDLFLFDPKTISANDLKRGLSNEKTLQMVAANLTVPHIVVSSFNVSSLENYINIMDRVLKALGSTKSMPTLLRSKKVSKYNAGKTVAELFQRRNSLVHEISLTDIGHRNIREFQDFDEVIEIGNVVLNLIRTTEFEITRVAPSEFPNLLDRDGNPVSTSEILAKNIRAMESRIRKESKAKDNLGEFTESAWDAVVAKSKKHLDSELEFIDSLCLAGFQYHDVRPHLKAGLLNRRLSYLELLSDEIAPDDDG